MANVEIYRDSRLDADQVREFGFSQVIVATGATWRSDGVGAHMSGSVLFAKAFSLSLKDRYHEDGTLLLGALFPLVISLWARTAPKLGRGIGTAYAANTAGTILGDGKYVECRVTVSALTKHCGANGIIHDKLHRAFKENREKIEAIAKSKYAAGNVTTEQDSPEQTRTVIVVDVADF